VRKAEEACEKIKNIRDFGLDFHILGGVGADPGEFPHMAAIGELRHLAQLQRRNLSLWVFPPQGSATQSRRANTRSTVAGR
jgi:hypothetical protein